VSTQIEGEYQPSPAAAVRDQVASYEASDGKEGGTLEGKPVVILTSTGAKSGKIRKTPVMRIERDGTYVVVASAGGATKHPQWYHNLVAQPLVRLQDHADVHTMRAREVTGEEKTLTTVCDAVPELLAALPPEEATRAWMDRFIDNMTTKRGMSDALRAVIISVSGPGACSISSPTACATAVKQSARSRP
jgi:F420H(2)-dependent quinone reductase